MKAWDSVGVRVVGAEEDALQGNEPGRSDPREEERTDCGGRGGADPSRRTSKEGSPVADRVTDMWDRPERRRRRWRLCDDGGRGCFHVRALCWLGMRQHGTGGTARIARLGDHSGGAPDSLLAREDGGTGRRDCGQIGSMKAWDSVGVRVVGAEEDALQGNEPGRSDPREEERADCGGRGGADPSRRTSKEGSPVADRVTGMWDRPERRRRRWRLCDDGGRMDVGQARSVGSVREEIRTAPDLVARRSPLSSWLAGAEGGGGEEEGWPWVWQPWSSRAEEVDGGREGGRSAWDGAGSGRMEDRRGLGGVPVTLPKRRTTEPQRGVSA